MEDNEEEITSHEICVVARSKKEAYDVLTTQGMYYFPPIESTRADFVADVLTGTKKVLKCKDVKVRVVPQIDGLRINDIINFAKSFLPIKSYFAESKTGYIILPRAFVCNLGKGFIDKLYLVNSLAPKEFDEFVQNALAKREKMYVIKKGIKLVAKSEFATLFKKFNSISRMNLTFHHLVRNSRKRRYEQKIKEERDEKQEKLSKELIEKNQAIDRLLQKVDELEAFKAQNDENLEKLSSLYESGLIDENGNIINKNVKPDIMN